YFIPARLQSLVPHRPLSDRRMAADVCPATVLARQYNPGGSREAVARARTARSPCAIRPRVRVGRGRSEGGGTGRLTNSEEGTLFGHGRERLYVTELNLRGEAASLLASGRTARSSGVPARRS